MNGGVIHAVEVLSPAELEAAAAGFRFFAFPEIANLLLETRASEHSEASEIAFNQRYWHLIPDDAPIVARFRAIFASSPGSFRPVAGAG